MSNHANVNSARHVGIWRRWLPLVFAVVWIALIFATSNTRYTGQCTKSIVVMAMAFCVAFAISDEWHQSFVPDRFGTVTDVLIDSAGVLMTGFLLLGRLHRRYGEAALQDEARDKTRLCRKEAIE